VYLTLPAFVGVSLMPVRLGMNAICRWIGAGIGRVHSNLRSFPALYWDLGGKRRLAAWEGAESEGVVCFVVGAREERRNRAHPGRARFSFVSPD
jgi:hypothetical protein